MNDIGYFCTRCRETLDDGQAICPFCDNPAKSLDECISVVASWHEPDCEWHHEQVASECTCPTIGQRVRAETGDAADIQSYNATPGPWEQDAKNLSVIRPSGPSFDSVATVQVSNVPNWEANARLIAAAPALAAYAKAKAEQGDPEAMRLWDMACGRAA